MQIAAETSSTSLTQHTSQLGVTLGAGASCENLIIITLVMNIIKYSLIPCKARAPEAVRESTDTSHCKHIRTGS